MDRNTVLLSVVLVIVPLSVSAASWWETGKELLGGNTANTTESAAPVSGLASLSSDEIAAGLKEALRVGAGNVVSQLGAQDGFYLDDAIRIPLPPQLHQANGLPVNVHVEAARLAAKAEQALFALDAEDATTAAWLAVEVGQNLERMTTMLAVAKALDLTPKANRDDRRQEGTRKERRPEITQWIEAQLSRRPDAKSPELWRIAPEWLTDQIGEDRFSKRVTAARKSLSGRK